MRYHVLEAVQIHAGKTPDKCALSDSRGSMDFATLERFSARLALHLRGLGCKPKDRVVLLTQRRAISVAAILGTFKAGCVHVPLDPRMPASRLEYILADIAPAAVITEQDLRDTVAAQPAAPGNILLVEDLDAILKDSLAGPEPDTASLPTPALEDPAYVIYTSGSTGRPKGVLTDHYSISIFFEGNREVYNVRAESICASFSPLQFDVYLQDMLFPLSEGATLHIHDDVIVPDLMFETIRANRVTHFSAWGRMLGLLAQAEAFDTAELPHVKTILTGTEVPDVKTVQRWIRKIPGVAIINAYGPTEATCCSVTYVMRKPEPDRQQLYPIGKPLKYVSAFLVDEQGQRITTPGVEGELFIGGRQVMRSYWNLPEETKARVTYFEDIRCYRTGDICSYLEDGNIFYLGRRDNEVNIGGYRVHLNEIQRVVNSVPHVHGSETVLLNSKYGEGVLAAAVLLDNGCPLPPAQQVELIRSRLAEELPAYMVPRYITVLDEFPRLSSGKPDRKALQSILEDYMNRQSQEVMAP